MSGIPAYVRTLRMEILAANTLCQALYGGALDEDKLPVNVGRYVFLDPHARGFFLDWDADADDVVWTLRMQAGRDVHDWVLSDLIGELSTRSDKFATGWARKDVRLHRTTRKRLGPFPGRRIRQRALRRLADVERVVSRRADRRTRLTRHAIGSTPNRAW